MGGAGVPVTDVGAGELLERGQPVDGVLSSGHAAAFPAGFPAAGGFHVADVLLGGDGDGVGTEVEGVHDPHARGVQVGADRGVRGADVAAPAVDQVRGPGKGLSDVQEPLVRWAVAGPALPELGAVHRLAHRVQPAHGGAVDGAGGTLQRWGQGCPQLGGALDHLPEGAQHRRRVLAGGVHEDLPDGELGVQQQLADAALILGVHGVVSRTRSQMATTSAEIPAVSSTTEMLRASSPAARSSCATSS